MYIYEYVTQSLFKFFHLHAWQWPYGLGPHCLKQHINLSHS